MRVALVVGLESYASPAKGGLGSLSGPHLYASRMQEKLLKLAGFDTILHCDFFGEPESTRQGIYLAIQTFRNKLKALDRRDNEGTVAFFYYSGHGGYNGKHHFLLPNDCRLKVDADVQGIDFEDQILHHMVKHASRSIAVLDCCRTGEPHHAGTPPVFNAPPQHQYLVCHACPAFTRAPDGSMYSHTLLKHIFKSDRPFFELVSQANAELARGGRQVPELGPHQGFPTGFVLVNQVGWRFAHWQDTDIGCDIEAAPVNNADGIANVRQLAVAAECHGMTAAAFNTLGYIKHTAGELVEMSMEHWQPEPAGVFVRDERVPHGWLYFPDMDSPGNTSRPNLQGSLFQMALEAANLSAVAFNTDGWAKYELAPFSAWKKQAKMRSQDGLHGIFVRVGSARPGAGSLAEARDHIIPDDFIR